jgi:hypothetical protein
VADTQIRGLGTGSAPLSYTVPGAQEIILKSLFASFNGAAASGSFLPCVRIVAPGGGVVAEYVTDNPIAAGGSAEVSFAPFLRTQRSSPPGTLLETIAVTAGGNTNIVSNVLVQIIPNAVVTFTVPPSGQVLARLGFVFGNSTNTNNYMGFVDGAGTEVHTKLFAGNVGAVVTGVSVSDVSLLVENVNGGDLGDQPAFGDPLWISIPADDVNG